MGNKIKKCLLMMILVTLVLCGCSLKEEKQCKEQVTKFLTAYQAQDVTCGEYLSGNEDDIPVQFEGFQSVLAKPIKFKIKSVEANKDYWIVDTVITNVDFGKVFEKLVNREDLQIDTTDGIIAELKKQLQAEDAPKRNFEVQIKLDKEQKIEMTGELSNALLGGYTQYIYELTERGAQ